jgi:hypothetical protein
MLTAYYSLGRNAKELFEGLKISEDPSFESHLNKYNVFFLNIQNFLSESTSIKAMVSSIKSVILSSVKKAYPSANFAKPRDILQTLYEVEAYAGAGFVFIIDEWDCVFRVFKDDVNGQKIYLDFLRLLLKDQGYVHLAYMTGILPIKKYGTHSALNMFTEFSMSNPYPLAEYVGFTELEVKKICDSGNLSFEQAKAWYDGYIFNDVHIYNPMSIASVVERRVFSNYWSQTETFEALKMPINLNFDGLKESISKLMSQQPVRINIKSFQNDMATFSSADDVLTLLVHLGYLAYDSKSCEVLIPNNEIKEEFKNAVENASWPGVSKLLSDSRKLVEDTLSLNSSSVAKAIQAAHNESTSILKYNDENSLCCVVTLAYYHANEHYIIFRELASGEGFIDMLFLPKPMHYDKPAILVELKWDLSADGAIKQVKDKHYPQKVAQYTGKIILVGINYDKKTKVHTCTIEEFTK